MITDLPEAHTQHELCGHVVRDLSDTACVARFEPCPWCELTALKAERDTLVAAVSDHVTVRNEYFAKIKTLEAERGGAKPVGYVHCYALQHLSKPGQIVINADPQDDTDIALYIVPPAQEADKKDAERWRWCISHVERAFSIFKILGFSYITKEVDAAINQQRGKGK